MKLCKKPESGIYYIDYTPKGGKRKRLTTGTKVEKEAQEMFDKLKHESWREDKLNEKQKPKRKWEEAVIRYLKDKKDIKSQTYITGELKNLEPYLKGKYLHEIDKDLINHIKYSRQASTYQRCENGEKYEISSNTANKTLKQLRAVLNCAKDEWDWIDSVPKFKLIEIRTDEEFSYNWFSHKEAKLVLKELPKHLQDAVKFSLSTGVRKKNLLGLKWKKVDLVRKRAYVDAIESKNKRPITIHLNDDALEILMSLQKNHEVYVFTYKGKPIKDSNTAAWKKALDRAGIRPYFPPPSAGKKEKSKYPSKNIDEYKYLDFRWHDLRHTWASWHVESGTTLKDLQELGGWRSYAMVLRYAHLSDNHVAKSANNISLDK